MSATNQSPYNATVIGREEIHADLIILRVRPDTALFDFKPGQFGVLGLTGSAPRIPEAAAEEPATELDKMIRPTPSDAQGSEITDVQVSPNLVRVRARFIGSKGAQPRATR